MKITTLINATKHSISGFIYLLRERAFIQELLCLPLLLMFLIYYETSDFAKIYCAFSYFLVLIIEALNTSIEAVVDRISLEKHDLSKQAKDIGSAAVFIAIVNFLCAIIYAVFFSENIV